jgi:8-oxo-dGTP diphosphatase
MDMDTVDSAIRILKDKTGVRSPYLEQLGTFAGAGRDPRGWSVSVVYYAVVPEQLLPSAEPDTLRWFPVDEVRTLPFDHLAILTAAAERIRSKTMYSSLPVHLMPAQFTLSQLQGVYEALLGTPLEKRTFRRWVDALDVIQEAPTPPEVVMAHRPAQHYSLRPKLKGALALAGKDLGGH